MGSALYVVTDPPVGSAAEVDGKALARHAEALDELAQSAGLRSLWSFTRVGADDLAAVLDEGDLDGLDLDDLAASGHDPAEGLAWLDALGAALEADGAGFVDDALRADMAAWRRILTAAAAVGACWHLGIDV